MRAPPTAAAHFVSISSLLLHAKRGDLSGRASVRACVRAICLSVCTSVRLVGRVHRYYVRPSNYINAFHMLSVTYLIDICVCVYVSVKQTNRRTNIRSPHVREMQFAIRSIRCIYVNDIHIHIFSLQGTIQMLPDRNRSHRWPLRLIIRRLRSRGRVINLTIIYCIMHNVTYVSMQHATCEVTRISIQHATHCIAYAMKHIRWHILTCDMQRIRWRVLACKV